MPRSHAPPFPASDEASPRTSGHRPWYRQKKVWLPPVILAGLFLVVFFALDPVVEWQTRKRLAALQPQLEVTFEDASLSPLRFTYVLEGLKVVKQPSGSEQLPYVFVERLELGVYARELFHGHLVARVRVDHPRLNLIAAKEKKDRQLDPEVPDLAGKLERMVPLKIDRVEVTNAAVLFVDKSKPEFPEVWLHDVDLTLENFATRAALARGEPTTLALSGTLQESGQLSVFLTADPLAKGLSFAGRMRLAGFELKELGKTMASESGLTVSRGTLDVFAEFECHAGKLEGGVKPVLKDVEVEQGKPGLGNAIKAVVADKAVDLLSDDVGGRDAVATVVPIRGDLTSPDVQLWPSIIGVLRNAFVVGVSESYAHLPLPEAGKKEGPVKQLIKGLDKLDTPKAQPEGGTK